MFPSQMVRLKIVEHSSGNLCKCFPHKWYALKLLYIQVAHFFCFPRKWYALKLSNPKVAHFFNVSLANGMP